MANKYNGMTINELVEEMGQFRLAGALNMSAQAVSQWQLFNTAPAILTAAAIIKISKGRCTYESIYKPFVDQHKEDLQLKFDFM